MTTLPRGLPAGPTQASAVRSWPWMVTRSPLRSDRAAWVARTPNATAFRYRAGPSPSRAARRQVHRDPQVAAFLPVGGAEAARVIGEVPGDGDGDHGVLLGYAGEERPPAAAGELSGAGSFPAVGQKRREREDASCRAARPGKMFCQRSGFRQKIYAGTEKAARLRGRPPGAG